MSGRISRTYPFTAAQWEELQHQTLLFKYLLSGLPIPPHLIFSINQNISFHQHQHMGVSNKIDPEPSRCRRTDGKKWRCSRQAFGDSKYCERHIHRGKGRPRNTFPYTSSSTTTHHSAASVTSKPVKDTTFMTFLGIESVKGLIDRSEKRERIMYQFIEESPHEKRDSWLNLLI
ncbi:hypothetical protein QQ045_023455 [Rhodiola kirilowii]